MSSSALFAAPNSPTRKQLMRGEGKVHRHVPLQSIADVKLGRPQALDQGHVGRVGEGTEGSD